MSVDSEGVITFKPGKEAQDVSEHPVRDDFARDDDDRSDAISLISDRSCSPSRTINIDDERAIGQIAGMMSSMASMFKDVVKELRELKQAHQVQRETVANMVENNIRKKYLFPNTETFRPRVDRRQGGPEDNGRSYQQVLRGQDSSSSPAEASAGIAMQPHENHVEESQRQSRPDNCINDEFHYHGSQRHSNRLPGNQCTYEPCDMNMCNRNDNQAFYKDMQDVQFNRGDYYIQSPPVHAHRSSRDTSHIKIPPFTGKDNWTVWITRFEALAHRMGWNSADKLDQLIPRIEGQAAEFVFTQLHSPVLQNYTALKAELNNRYRVIETPRLYASRFSRRTQKVVETAEEFAAELKVLYDKAHGFRDRKIRDEDLVRRFLDGLRDDDIRFEVEYNKEPETIDDAVFQVVNYIHTRNLRDRRSRENIRRANDTRSRSNEEGTDRKINQNYSNGTKLPYKQSANPCGTELKQAMLNDREQQGILEEIRDRLEKLENRFESKPRWRNREEIECFSCHKLGHFARDCPEKSKWRAEEDEPSRSIKSEHIREERPLNFNGPVLVAKGRSNRL